MMSRSENFLQTSHYASLWPLASSYKPCTSPSILIHPFFRFFLLLDISDFSTQVFFAFLSDFSIGPFPATFFCGGFLYVASLAGLQYLCSKLWEGKISLLHPPLPFPPLTNFFSSFPPHPPLKGRVGASPPFPPFNLLTAVSHYPRVPPSGNLSAKNTLRVDLLRKIPTTHNIIHFQHTPEFKYIFNW